MTNKKFFPKINPIIFAGFFLSAIFLFGFLPFSEVWACHPTVDIKANGSDGPITIDYNTSAELTWTSTRATACTASGDWSGEKAVFGSENTGNLTSSKTYIITCTGAGGSATDSVTVDVLPQPTLDVELIPIPDSGMAPLNDVDLEATVSGTATGMINYKFDCTNDGVWDYTFVNIPDNPKTVVDACDYPSAGTYTAKVYVERGAASPAEDTALIIVFPSPAPTVDIKANGSDGPITIDYNTSAELSWVSANADSCTASGSWSGGKAVSGSENTGNLTSSKTYIITCTGLGGAAVDSVTVNVLPQSIPGLTISKSGRNLSQGQSYFSDSISAKPSERIEFKIEITSTGNATADNVMVKDVLPNKINYLGNLKVDGSFVGGTILDGINLGNLAVGESKAITFETQVEGEDNFAYGTTTLINTGQTWADNVVQISDTALVNVTKESPPPASPGLSIDKLVRNLSEGTGFSNSVSAKPSDLIEFKIRINSIGTTTASNIVLEDVLPSRMSYQGNLKINGISSSGDIVSGLNLGSLAPDASTTVTFEAKIDDEDNFGYGTTTLINTANVEADGIATVYDSASLNVVKSSSPQVVLSIEKKVKNLTKGETSWKETVSAGFSDKIAFKILVSSTGNTTASDVVVKDTLPSKIDWYGNLEIDGVSFDDDIAEGINIGSLGPGQSKTITFEAKVAAEDEFPYGTTDLINTVIAYNVDTSATGTAKVRVRRTGVAGAVTSVSTGVLDSFLLSLGITFILTYCFLLGSFFYQRVFVRSGISIGSKASELKSKAESWYYSLHLFDSQEKSERRLRKTISEIRRKGN